jgi:hypothetical protein
VFFPTLTQKPVFGNFFYMLLFPLLFLLSNFKFLGDNVTNLRFDTASTVAIETPWIVVIVKRINDVILNEFFDLRFVVFVS